MLDVLQVQADKELFKVGLTEEGIKEADEAYGGKDEQPTTGSHHGSRLICNTNSVECSPVTVSGVGRARPRPATSLRCSARPHLEAFCPLPAPLSPGGTCGRPVAIW